MVHPVLKVLTINGLSLVVKESTLTGGIGEGDNKDGEDCELTSVAAVPSLTKEPVDSWVTWPPQNLGDARVFLPLLGVMTLAAGGSSSIGWSSSSLTCAKAEADNFIIFLAQRHLDSKVCTDNCGNRPE